MKIKSKLKNKFIPVNVPKIFNQEKINVKKCLDTGWISSEGMYVKKFEESFSRYNKRIYGVAVSSGTAALEIGMKSLNLKKGDEVIIPTFSIISTALCVIKLGLKPVLVDSNIHTWNMDSDQVIKKITKKTKAIIITHIYGFPVDMKKVLVVAKRKNIKIIEDSAEMIGQTYLKRRCGTFGDLSTFSFYANKHITTGEGGMILTNDKKIYNKCKSLRNLCFGKINRFNHDDIGWNYRMTNIQASLGLSQLKNIKYVIKKKMKIGSYYYKKLYKNSNIQIQPPLNAFSKNIYWIVGIVIKKGKITASVLSKKLARYGIGTRPFFWPMHKQEIFLKKKIFKKQKFPNSEYLSKYGLYLPSGLKLKKKEINYICKSLNEILH